MTLSATELALYAGALFILFLTPGPVWLALTARALSGGFHSAWPLALGVVIGDALWPLLAILGVTWIVGQMEEFLTILRYVGAGMFVTMGVLLIRNADKTIAGDSRLTRPGMWAGFIAGLVVILGNPKAILFYMGVLPGFFDLTQVTWVDIAAIMATSMLVPFIGNLIFAAFVDRIRRFLASGEAIRRTNLIAGGLMILVGVLIAVL
ncbi:LysE family translocator [Pseudooceanicola atlanticus]|jgi:threonine/homoserine/homoserine lactone efflux protein|uniref:Amino acid transporter LysE n=1 Tax=Pseudooceanicola atlanticus TaxID=1461694 RepID=A0A0A0EI15_9RHOB|nr:LysE family translocator [Pseudooceanicola atlanticus]KGM49955.1 amino acid transporter LysE [Pseudooceanicola atlanticus]